MALQEQVAHVFAHDGPLARQLPEYRPRAGQVRMAGAVAAVIGAGGCLVVEAGTGIGKTFAYLVPALLSGKRVLVSTASKALQDQLFGRDIPQLARLLGAAVRVAMLKGRSSYLCLERLQSAREQGGADLPGAGAMLAHMERWAQSTRSGDLAEVPELDDNSALVPLVTSTRENCLGSACPRAASCFVNQARRLALAADVVVINHHLFFADFHIRESGVAELLPSVHAVVFDEAHQLNEIGVQFLGRQISSFQLAALARDVQTEAATLAGGYARWDELAHVLVRCSVALTERFASTEQTQRLDWQVLGTGGQAQLLRISDALLAVRQALEAVAAMAPPLQQLAQRSAELASLMQLFAASQESDTVRWIELGRHWRLQQAPLDIAPVMQSRVLAGPAADPAGAAHAPQAAGKAWIFTSATLGHDARLSWFVDSCGLADAQLLQVPSPFDYARQAALYIPQSFAQPGDPAHSLEVAALAFRGASLLGGRTLVLTTTLRAMRSIGLALREQIARHAPLLQVLVQGESPKRELLARFSAAGVDPGGGMVLVASASFWEGIDIPGAALQLVLIDKLPFAPPDDPLQQARARRLEGKGKSAFGSLHLPQAAVALKQGAGRLIRRESDQGVLVVCDTRLRQKSYGAKLLAALPPMQRLDSQAAFEDRLGTITRTSTTPASASGSPWPPALTADS